MSVNLNCSKRGSMALDRLANPSIPTVQLHRSLYFEGRGICRVARDTNKDHPLLIVSDPIVDDLAA